LQFEISQNETFGQRSTDLQLLVKRNPRYKEGLIPENLLFCLLPCYFAFAHLIAPVCAAHQFLSYAHLAFLSNNCQTPSSALRRGTLQSERHMAQFTIRAESKAFQAHSRTAYDPLSPQVEIRGQEEWVEMMCQRADSRCFISLGLFDASPLCVCHARARD
jgi:hypothetical protein